MSETFMPKEVWKLIDSLTEDEIDRLCQIMRIGFLNEFDREEKIMALQTEDEREVLKALQIMRKSRDRRRKGRFLAPNSLEKRAGRGLY